MFIHILILLFQSIATSASCDFDSIEANSITIEQFRERYLSTNRPVLLKHAATHWPAMTKWDTIYLAEQLKNVYDLHDLPNNGTLTGLPLILYKNNYLFVSIDKVQGNILLETWKQFVDDKSIQEVPLPSPSFSVGSNLKPFVSGDVVPVFLFNDWYTDGKQNHKYFMIGKNTSGLSFHSHQEAWNGLIIGQKRWFLFKPEDDAFFFDIDGVYRSILNEELTHPRKEKEIFLNQTLQQLSTSPMECIQNAGDVLYIPDMYHHAVFNIGEMTVAVSEIHDQFDYNLNYYV